MTVGGDEQVADEFPVVRTGGGDVLKVGVPGREPAGGCPDLVEVCVQSTAIHETGLSSPARFAVDHMGGCAAHVRHDVCAHEFAEIAELQHGIYKRVFSSKHLKRFCGH